MSPIRCKSTGVVGAVAACALLWGLSACSGSGDDEPTAARSGRHHDSPSSSSTPTDSPSSSGPPKSTSPPASTAALRFSPKSGGKHLDDCQLLVPGDDPAEFLYYPVLVTANSQVEIDSISTDHTQGVVDAASWVAPSVSTTGTGTVKGWPPGRIVTGDKNLRWSQRVPARGAELDPMAGWYNVFLHLQVDPTPGDSAVNGIVFSYHDAAGSHTDTWIAHTTFSMDC
jgi:hypothetical protein